jgi:hypothetical protein
VSITKAVMSVVVAIVVVVVVVMVFVVRLEEDRWSMAGCHCCVFL